MPGQAAGVDGWAEPSAGWPPGTPAATKTRTRPGRVGRPMRRGDLASSVDMSWVRPFPFRWWSTSSPWWPTHVRRPAVSRGEIRRFPPTTRFGAPDVDKVRFGDDREMRHEQVGMSTWFRPIVLVWFGPTRGVAGNGEWCRGGVESSGGVPVSGSAAGGLVKTGDDALHEAGVAVW